MWTLPDRQSRWYRGGDDEKAATDVQSLLDQDVYIGAGLSSKNRGKKRRGEASEIAGMIGLWADIDIEDFDAHRKSNLPASEEAAREVLATMYLPPTILIHSGHGLQAWWLFEEPWVFTSDEEREEASKLSVMWYATMRVHAAEMGWTIDAVHDLTRVLRLPGTTNHKGPPVAVRLLEADGPRYNPSDFWPYIVDEAKIALLTGRRTYRVGEITLDANAQPNIDKFEALKANDPKFQKTLDRKRTDLNDDSPSGYDMALAAIAAGAGWSDQEIANLIIYARRKRGDDLEKVTTRGDYMTRTISAARAIRAGTEAVRNLGESTDQLESTKSEVQVLGTGSERLPFDRKKALEDLCDSLGIEIAVVREYLTEPRGWEVVTTGGPLAILTSADLFQQTTVRHTVFDRTKHTIPTFKADVWRGVVRAIGALADPIEIGLETTAAGKAYSWLNDYLGDRVPLDDRDEACDTKQPFVDEDGSTFVFGQHLSNWLWMSRGEKINATRLGQILRAGGCDYVKLNYSNRAGRRSSSSAWKIPPLGEFEWPKYDEEGG